MAFDPDAFLAKTDPKKSGFDPDAFLAKTDPKQNLGIPSAEGGEFGSPHDISDKGPETFRQGYERYAKPYVEALPAAGGIVGGVIGSPLGPLGIMGGGGLGAGAGKALENLIEMGVGEEKTTGQLYLDPLKEGATDVAFAGGAGLLGKGLGAAGKSVRGLLPFAKQPVKQGAGEIVEAGQRIGAKPTRGMLTSSEGVGEMESALAQKTGKIGRKYRQQYEDLFGGLQKAGEDVFRGIDDVSPIKASEDARSGLLKGVQKRVDETRPFFQTAKAESEFIDLPSKAKEGFAKSIENLEYARIKGTPESSLAKNISENLKQIDNLQDLKNLRSYVGQSMSDPMAPGSMKKTAGDIYGKLADLEQKAITRASLQSASSTSTGSRMAKEMRKQLKTANKLYSQMNKDLQDLAQKSGLGKVKNYSQFITKVQGLSDEKLAKKMFDSGNVKQLETLKKQFPDVFEDLRKAKMQDIYNNSLTKGEVSISKLLNKVKKMSPEAKKLVLGEENVQKVKDIETIYNNLTRKIGPSGTPEGELLMNFKVLDPRTWWGEMNDKITDYLMENPQARDLMPRDAARGLLRTTTKARAARGLLGGEDE